MDILDSQNGSGAKLFPALSSEHSPLAGASSLDSEQGNHYQDDVPTDPVDESSIATEVLNRPKRQKRYIGDDPLASARRRIACSVVSGAHSVTGNREKNEDSYLISDERRLWAVSDGIGGAPFGEVISTVACNYVSRAWDSTAQSGDGDVESHLLNAIRQTDDYVSELSILLGSQGSGATLALAHYDGSTLSVASVGDTRTYLLRDGILEQVSKDGRLSQSTNQLDQALGYHMALKPTVFSFDPLPMDVLTLCTDGVWSKRFDQQPEPLMAEALSKGLSQQGKTFRGNPQRMAYELVESSDMTDNATAIVLLFVGAEEPVASSTPIMLPQSVQFSHNEFFECSGGDEREEGYV